MTDSGASGARRLRRALVLVGVVVLATSAATAGFGAATDATTETTTTTSNPVTLVYVNASTDTVTFVREDGTQVGTNVSADVVGPMTDLDGDGVLEAPYVTDQGALKTIDVNGEGRSIDTGVPYSSTKVGVGDWTGDGVPEIVYPDTNGNVYYANVTGSPTGIGSEAASAVLGVADFDGSGGKDVVFVGTSQNLHYYNGTTSVDTQYGNFANSGAVGAPADVYRNGTLWVPAVDGSGIPEIIDSEGTVDQFRQSSNNTDKKPVAAVDWAGDDTLEVVHLQGGELAYTNSTGSTRKITDADGQTTTAVLTAGVAGVASYPANLSVEAFAANASAGQNVTVNVTTNHDLSALNVTLDGPENATLTLSDFRETGTNPYSYTATYDGGSDGEYAATLERAASDGDGVSSAGTANATVDEVVPSVNGVNLADATDGDGLVAPGDSVAVTANVTGDVGVVTANLSAFGANDSVELTHAGGDTYNRTVEVGESAVDGNQSAMVTASDGQGNADSAETANLTVDTEVLDVALNDSRTVTVGEEVQFSPQSVANATGDVAYNWTFGDGDAATSKTVTHTFDSTATYEVTLTANDSSEDTARASMKVEVVSDSTATTEDTSSGDSTDGGSTDDSDGGVDWTDPATTEATQTATTTATETATATPTATERTPTPTEATTEATPSGDETVSSGETTTEQPADQTPGEAPGFGAVGALLALVAAAALALRGER